MWSYITDNSEIKDSIPKIMVAPFLGIDIESRGLDPLVNELLLVQIATPDQTFIYDARFLNLTEVFSALSEYNNPVIFHNAKFDIKFLIKNYGFIPNNIFDTMVGDVITRNGLGNQLISLSDLTHKYLGFTLDKGVRKTFEDHVAYFSDEQLDYAATDADVLLKIYPHIQKLLKERNLQTISDIEHRLVPVVSKMELDGINFSKNTWGECVQTANKIRIKVEEDLRNLLSDAGTVEVEYERKGEQVFEKVTAETLNLNSHVQVKAFLNALGINVSDTNADTLSNIENETVQTLLKFRRYDKKVRTYGYKYFEHIHPLTKRIHAEFNQIGTYTGRFSSDNPNLQNVINPYKDPDGSDINYRLAFIPTEGFSMITADYSQIELRIGAERANEKKLIDAFIEDLDPHSMTASLVYNLSLDKVGKDTRERTIAKNINFAIFYGSGALNLYRKFQIPLDIGTKIINRFFSAYPNIDKFIREEGIKTLAKGFSETILGRRRYFRIPSFSDPDFKKKSYAVRREGVNHIIQGSSADMIKLAMIYIDQELQKYGGRVLLTVHDEIVSEIPTQYAEEGHQIVQGSMIKAGKEILSKVPIGVEGIVGQAWSK